MVKAALTGLRFCVVPCDGILDLWWSGFWSASDKAPEKIEEL